MAALGDWQAKHRLAVSRLGWWNLAASIGVLGGLAVLGTGMYRRHIRPYGELGEFIDKVSREQDFSLRASRVGRNEAGRFTLRVNRLLEAIEVQEKTLQARRASLEDRIADRNQELVDEIQERCRSEEQLDRLFTVSQDLLSVVAFDGQIRSVNPAHQKVLGLGPEELVATAFIDLVHPTERAVVQLEIERLARGEPTTNLEHRFRCQDGSYRWVLWNASPVADSRVFYTFGRDLADRKAAEDRLEQEVRLATLGAEIGDALTRQGSLPAILQACAESMVKHLGAAFARVWILDARENVLELRASAGLYTHLDGAHSRVPVGVLKIGAIAKEGKPHLTNSVIGDPRVGDQEWARREGMVAFAGYPLIVADRVVGVMAMFARHELSPNVLGELASCADAMALGVVRKQAEDELNSTRAFLSSVVQNLPIAVFIKEAKDLRFVLWNKAGEQLLGYSNEELVGKNDFDLFPEKEATSFVAKDRETFENGRLCEVEEESIQTRHRGTRLLHTRKIPVFDDHGRPSFLLGICEDITDRKKAEQERLTLELQLRQSQKLESIGQLAAGIAHEINTPIQFIGDNTRFVRDALGDLYRLLSVYHVLFDKSHAGTLTTDVLKEVEQAMQAADVDYLVTEIPKAIEQTLDGVDRVSKIVRAMKEFSHPGTTEKAMLDLPAAIQSTLIVCRNEWKYVADTVTHFDLGLPRVPVYPGEFNQAILNMIVNAAHAIADATSNGANGKGVITLSTLRDGDWAEIRIADTGPGIPPAIRDRVFDPFFTTKAVGKGTGQGLAMARSVVVDKHGGTISIETEMGRGTCFVVRLPLGVPGG